MSEKGVPALRLERTKPPAVRSRSEERPRNKRSKRAKLMPFFLGSKCDDVLLRSWGSEQMAEHQRLKKLVIKENKSVVIQNHKNWLKYIQTERRKLLDAKEAEDKIKQEKTTKVKEQLSNLRSTIRNSNTAADPVDRSHSLLAKWCSRHNVNRRACDSEKQNYLDLKATLKLKSGENEMAVDVNKENITAENPIQDASMAEVMNPDILPESILADGEPDKSKASEQDATKLDLHRPLEDISNKPSISLPSVKDLASRPKWMLTPEENEALESCEIDELIKFADDLDFEKYIEDLEVQEAVQAMQTRVEEIDSAEKDENITETKLENSDNKIDDYLENAATLAEDISKPSETNVLPDSLLRKKDHFVSHRSKEDIAKSARELRSRVLELVRKRTHRSNEKSEGSIAESVTSSLCTPEDILKSNSRMRAIHSTKSTQALIDRIFSPVSDKKSLNSTELGNIACPEPLKVFPEKESDHIMTLKERLEVGLDMGKLPYMHRHPGV